MFHISSPHGFTKFNFLFGYYRHWQHRLTTGLLRLHLTVSRAIDIVFCRMQEKNCSRVG